ncbi:hypothetical protein LM602_06315 [Candidatus Acetothermia bacterium]|nr:hypothetical protein [Candidatus Acetothermia bacterium]MCI2432151.1 hypothetical protein [Candidatus Acetothermia bacterium]MCI2436156.1 hypothetical protein [Candidatus Acetothermia bacterium]
MIRLKHMSRCTEASYLHYIIDYIRFHVKRHPQEMGAVAISPPLIEQLRGPLELDHALMMMYKRIHYISIL